MKITATNLRRQLHEALKTVAEGKTVTITRHGKDIAYLTYRSEPKPSLEVPPPLETVARDANGTPVEG